MKVVTVSREFGSGGRELGKRLADHLGFVYYDREIIAAIAEKSNLEENYIESMLQGGLVQNYAFTFGRTFGYPIMQENTTKILIAQQQVIREIAAKDEDCIIVGRGADILLEGHHPFDLFVYADMQAKIDRCRSREDSEHLTDRAMARKIRQIDKGRASYRALLAEGKWGAKESYHLCVNTTGASIKKLAPIVADYIRCWFETNGDE